MFCIWTSFKPSRSEPHLSVGDVMGAIWAFLYWALFSSVRRPRTPWS